MQRMADRRPRRSSASRTGVRPRGAGPRRTVGVQKPPGPSRDIRDASRRKASRTTRVGSTASPHANSLSIRPRVSRRGFWLVPPRRRWSTLRTCSGVSDLEVPRSGGRRSWGELRGCGRRCRGPAPCSIRAPARRRRRSNSAAFRAILPDPILWPQSFPHAGNSITTCVYGQSTRCSPPRVPLGSLARTPGNARTNRAAAPAGLPGPAAGSPPRPLVNPPQDWEAYARNTHVTWRRPPGRPSMYSIPRSPFSPL